MKHNIASFSRVWKLADLPRVTCAKRLGLFAKSTDCHSERSSCPDDDPCLYDPCRPWASPKQDPPCPCPKPPTGYGPHSDPYKVIFWRTLSLFIALPLVVITSMITYRRVQEEAKKPREPFLNLPYLCRRTKPFPWGDGNHTLFHNPVKNPVPPHGYEVEDPNAIYKKPAN